MAETLSRTARRFTGLPARRRFVGSVWPSIQYAVHMLRIVGDECQIGPRRLIRLGAALFPIPQCAERDVIANGKLLLRQLQGPANDLRLWRSFHPLEIGFGQRLGVTIRPGGPLNGFGSHQRKTVRRFAPCHSLQSTILRETSTRVCRSTSGLTRFSDRRRRSAS